MMELSQCFCKMCGKITNHIKLPTSGATVCEVCQYSEQLNGYVCANGSSSIRRSSNHTDILPTPLMDLSSKSDKSEIPDNVTDTVDFSSTTD